MQGLQTRLSLHGKALGRAQANERGLAPALLSSRRRRKFTAASYSQRQVPLTDLIPTNIDWHFHVHVSNTRVSVCRPSRVRGPECEITDTTQNAGLCVIARKITR